MTCAKWIALTLVGALVLIPAVACQQTEGPGATAVPEVTPTGSEPFHGLLPYRQKDAKLALVRPTLVRAAEAQLADGVSVVGVSIDGEARAYPLYVLKNHQVVNDWIGEVPVAGSW